MSYERIGEDLKRKAKEADLVSYLKARHPRSVRFSDHPDKPGFVCWRSVEHDSLTFYRKEDCRQWTEDPFINTPATPRTKQMTGLAIWCVMRDTPL